MAKFVKRFVASAGGSGPSDRGGDGSILGKAVASGEPVAGEPATDVRGVSGDGADGGDGGFGDGEGLRFIDPEYGSFAGSGGGSGAGSGGGKRRGRPPGSRNRNPGSERSKAERSKTTQDLTDLLVTTHFFLSKIAKVEEIQIEPDEAKLLSGAITRVTDLYEIPLPSEKVMAWIGLATVASQIYGPRIVAVGIRHKSRPKTVDAKPYGPMATAPKPNGSATPKQSAVPFNPAMFEGV